MSTPLSLSSLPLPSPQQPPPLTPSSLLSLSGEVWHHRQAWRCRHQAWRCCQAWHRRVCATSLVLLPRGVASLPSVALSSQSVESSPSLVLLPSISKLGVVIIKRAPSGVALLPRLAPSHERGVITKRAPSCVASLPSGVVLLHKHGIVVIVAGTIDTIPKIWVCPGADNQGPLLLTTNSTQKLPNIRRTLV